MNQYLRLGLNTPAAPEPREPFQVEARDLGELRPGLSLDNVSELVEQAEGPLYR